MVTPIEIRNSEILLDDGRNALLLTFVGDLDESNIDDIAKQVYSHLDDRGEKAVILFDFTELGYLNSKSIGYLSDWYTKLTERSSVLAVGGVRENVLDILQTVGLDNFIHFFSTLEEAKEFVGGKKKEPQKKEEPQPKSAGIQIE